MIAFFISVAIVEVVIALIGRWLPDWRNWKFYGILAYLVPVVGLCLFIYFAGALERKRGDEITAEACVAVEELIRSGRQAELAEAIKKIEWRSLRGSYPDKATLFRQEVKKVEAGK